MGALEEQTVGGEEIEDEAAGIGEAAAVDSATVVEEASRAEEVDVVVDLSKYTGEHLFFLSLSLTQLTSFNSQPGQQVPSPAANVTAAEDAYAKGLNKLDLSKLSLNRQQPRFPPRPGYGKGGKGVTLWANYFEMMPSPKLVLHRYSIAISPDATGKKLAQIVRLMYLDEYFSTLKDDMVTDFRSNIISRVQFKSPRIVVKIKYRNENEDTPKESATEYQVKIEESGRFAVETLIASLTSTSIDIYPDKPSAVQALNIILGHHGKASQEIATVGKNKSFSITGNGTGDLRSGLIALRGFFTSVRAATARILVNINVTNGAFYEPAPLNVTMNKHGLRSLPLLERFLKRIRVKVIHLPEKKNAAGQPVPRIKTIMGLASKSDGQGTEHPPIVKAFGAGPRDVQFYFDAPAATSSSQSAGAAGGSKKGKAAKSAAAAPSGGRYITVYDFFRQRKQNYRDIWVFSSNLCQTTRTSDLQRQIYRW